MDKICAITKAPAEAALGHPERFNLAIPTVLHPIDMSTTREPRHSPPTRFASSPEFDFKGENQVVYEENGVTIRLRPAIHAGDGPLSMATDMMIWNLTRDGVTEVNKR